MAEQTKVRVPKEAGDEITVRKAGRKAEKFKVQDGHVMVPSDSVGVLLSNVDGAKVAEPDTKEKA